MIHSLKYLRSPTLKCKDIGIRKSEFVTKTQFLYVSINIVNQTIINKVLKREYGIILIRIIILFIGMRNHFFKNNSIIA